MWQEENFERPWCMQCFGGRCGAGENIKVSKCDGDNTMFSFINQVGNETQIYIPKDDKCLESRRDEDNLKVEDCDNSNPAQRFRAGPGLSLDGDRFELIPVVQPDSNIEYCMTQRHHPKEGEVIYREVCETARNDKTSMWNKY